MRNYRDLQVWNRAHRVTLRLYRATRSFSDAERFGLTSQIRRAASSIGANLAEGCGRRGDGEFARFVQIAMGSASELDYHLLLARDLGLLRPTDYAGAAEEVDHVRRMLTALLSKVSPRSMGRGSEERKAKSEEP